jgi:hypothetical protein
MKQYRLTPITETAEQATEAKSQKGKIAKQILLGIDAHLNGYQVGRKIDAGGIQPVQSFKLEKLLLFASKQLELAEKVYAVYEAGPLGYVLYHKLKELGIEAMVSAPECLEAGSKRKHNKINASKLSGRLYINPRIRVLLVEMAWRLVKFQLQYKPIQQWRSVLTGTNKALKKKAIVAVARRLFIDIWRIRTGRITLHEAGFVLTRAATEIIRPGRPRPRFPLRHLHLGNPCFTPDRRRCRNGNARALPSFDRS